METTPRLGAGRRCRPRPALVGGGAVIALLVAGCGAAVPSSNGGPATVTVQTSELGKFLVDGQGHSLYLFEKDEEDESYCDGACASIWPPLETSGSVQATDGVSTSGLGTFKRDDGDLQVSYQGQPLYYYAGDGSEPGETYGQGIEQFGAEWYLVQPDGQTLENKPQSGGS